MNFELLKNQVLEFLIQSQELIIGGLALSAFYLTVYFYIKIKSYKTKQFLYTNGYTETNFRTNLIQYPEVIIKQDKVIIKNCYAKSFNEVLSDKHKWEKFLSKKILSVEDLNGKTIIFLEESK